MVQARVKQERKPLVVASPRPDYAEIGAAFIVLAAGVFALGRLDLLPQRFTLSEQMGYGLVFAIGLVASVSSCMAVTGGLLVAAAAKYNDASPKLTLFQRLQPPLQFKSRRIASHTLLLIALAANGA